VVQGGVLALERPDTREDTHLGCPPEIRTEELERETGFEPATFCLGRGPSAGAAGGVLAARSGGTPGDEFLRGDAFDIGA
jgi:hypothetical protein